MMMDFSIFLSCDDGRIRNNIEGTLNLVECMKKQPGCRKLVFSSSATVYGEPDKLPLDESSSVGVGITNPYGVYVCMYV